MEILTLCIISADRSLATRWHNSFTKEGWSVSFLSSYTQPPEQGTSSNEFALIEVGPSGCCTPDAMMAAIKIRKPLSVLAFGDQKKISNAQIASFLETGADDFVFKDIDPRVLVAKLKAHMRRLAPLIKQAASICASAAGDITVDTSRRSVRLGAKGRSQELTNLTQKELDILTLLLGHEKRVLSREVMLEKLWGAEAVNVYSECVDKHIESLRRKLGSYGKRIKTVYGAGYMFTAES